MTTSERPSTPSASRRMGALTSELTCLVVRIARSATGRGPTKARAYLTDDVVTVVLQETLTRFEETLVHGGHRDIVAAGRSSALRTKQAELIAGVEAITRARVRSAHVSHHTMIDTTVMTFVLDLPGH